MRPMRLMVMLAVVWAVIGATGLQAASPTSKPATTTATATTTTTTTTASAPADADNDKDSAASKSTTTAASSRSAAAARTVQPGCGILKPNDKIVLFGSPGDNGQLRLIADALKSRFEDFKIDVTGSLAPGRVTEFPGRLQKDVLDKKPTIVIIQGGLDDCWTPNKVKGFKPTTREDYRKAMISVVDQLQAAGIEVVLCTPMLAGERGDGSNPQDQYMEDYSRVCRTLAKEKNLRLADLRKDFNQFINACYKRRSRDRGCLTSDGGHLSYMGNLLLARKLLQALGLEYWDIVPGMQPSTELKPALKKGDRILIVGDTIVAGATGPKGFVTLINDTIERRCKDMGIEVFASGMTNSKVDSFTKKIMDEEVARQPTIVIVFIGYVNDLWGKASTFSNDEERWEKANHGWLKAATMYTMPDKPSVGYFPRALFCTPALNGENSNQYDAMMDWYSDCVRTNCFNERGQLVDLRSAFLKYLREHNPQKKPNGILTVDGKVPNDMGHRLIAVEILKALGVPTEDELAARAALQVASYAGSMPLTVWATVPEIPDSEATSEPASGAASRP